MRVSLRFKWIALVIFFIVFIATAICVVSIKHGTAIIREELVERGMALASGLGFNSEYGLFTEDKVELDRLIKSTTKSQDISYSRIYNLFQWSRYRFENQ